MQNTYLEHPAEDVLERFLLHQSNEEETEVVETHFLACESCVTRLENLEMQIAAIKLALQEVHKEQVAKAVARERATWRNWFTVPRLSMVGAVAALALGVFLAPQFTGRSTPVAQISLVAYRGLETPTVPKDHQLHVHLNATDLNRTSVQVELVDDRGSQLWKATAPVHQDEIDVNVPQISETGTHFFRIYAPGSGGDEELLREFAFQVR
jgi:hypothetical protein